jgi:hypothetical protein
MINSIAEILPVRRSGRLAKDELKKLAAGQFSVFWSLLKALTDL